MSPSNDINQKSPFDYISALSPFNDIARVLPMNIVSVNDLAAAVRQLRNERGWTQLELAGHSGVSRDWIIALEKGKSSLELALVLRTLKALDVKLTINDQKPSAPSDDVINLDDLLQSNPEDEQAS